MKLLGKVQKLMAEPGFKAQPATVLLRGARLLLHAATRSAPVFPLTPGGPMLTVPADLRYTSVTAFMLRAWVEPELYHLPHWLAPGAVFLDVGANIGLFALRAAILVGPSGRVIAVEPAEVSADRLERNLALNAMTHVTVVRAALSDREGEAELRHVELGNDPQAWSIIPEAGGAGAEKVRTTTLDALAEAQGLTRLDLVKLDVEGAEPMIVAGGRATLTRFRPTIIFEVNSPPSLARADRTDCFDALVGMGYGIFAMAPRDGALTVCHAQGMEHGNLIAIPPGTAGRLTTPAANRRPVCVPSHKAIGLRMDHAAPVSKP